MVPLRRLDLFDLQCESNRRRHLHCITPALEGGARERSAVQVNSRPTGFPIEHRDDIPKKHRDDMLRVRRLAPLRECSPAPLTLPTEHVCTVRTSSRCIAGSAVQVVRKLPRLSALAGGCGCGIWLQIMPGRSPCAGHVHIPSGQTLSR